MSFWINIYHLCNFINKIFKIVKYFLEITYQISIGFSLVSRVVIMGGGSKITLKDYANVARLEYLPAEAPAIFIPLLLTATALSDLVNFYYLEAILAFGLLYFSGFIINSYTDVSVDKRYKVYVASSSTKLGPVMLKNLVIIQVTLAILLIIHIAWAINALWLIPVCLLGIFMGLAYSVKPFEFKVKGIFHIISLLISAFMVPFILLYTTVSTNYSWYVILFLFGFPIAHYGIALANQTGDFLEDKSEGLKSPAVRWGLNNTLKLAKSMTFIGLCLELVAFYGLIWLAPWLHGFEAAIGLTGMGRYLLIVLTTLIMCLAYSVPLSGLFSIHEISNLNLSIEKRMNKIKNRMNYPIWQAAGIWGLVTTSTIIMVSGVVIAG
jgi:1,4-dihydroxy-2-naphthoate octaprenyltransferase